VDRERPPVPVVAREVGHESGEDLEGGEGDALGAVRGHGRSLHQIEDMVKTRSMVRGAGEEGPWLWFHDQAMSPVPRRRVAARVVLLDDLDRVLLFRGFDPADVEAGFWWFTPGGGVDPEESLEQAARRELIEETGINDVDLGPRLWTRLAQFSFEGIAFEQREWFFLARTARRAVDTSGFMDYEQRSMTDHRWWGVDELRQSDEVVWPTGLASLLATLLTAGPPVAVIEID